MGTKIRPELSLKNKYWIEKHRYYELKHFCLQYPVWKKAYEALDSLSQRPINLTASSKTNASGDPVGKCVEAREYYFEKMKTVEQTALEAGGELSEYILAAVTEGVSYGHLKARLDMPCGKDAYYELYRKFFWLLNRARN